MKTPEQRRKYNLRLYHERRKELVERLGGRCVVCGTTENLEFDHKDPTTKTLHLSRQLTRAKTIIEHECTKCQLLCRTCHILKSRNDGSRSVLTDVDVHEIKTRYTQGNVTQQQLAEEFGVSPRTISAVVTGYRRS